MLVPVYDIANCGPRHRFGANGKLVSNCNWQNLTRQEKDGRPGQIRSSIIAPPGKKIVVADLSQIECRMLNFLAGEQSVLDQFARGEDVYANLATRFYGRKITRADKNERHLFKEAELGCGYGMGILRFKAHCAEGGKPVTDDEARGAVETYRESHPNVVRYWKTAQNILGILAARGTTTWGPMEIDDGAIWLPNGLPLWYDERRIDADSGDEMVRVRGQWRRIYGAKLVENVVQALARVAMSDAMLRISARYRPINTTHDELMVLADIDDAECLPYILGEMKKTPAWAPGLPLDAEGAEGERYAK